MMQFNNLSLKNTSNLINVDENMVLLKAIDKTIDIIIAPKQLNKLLKDKGNRESIVSIYSSICIFIMEIKELIDIKINIEELVYQYMVMIRQIVQSIGQPRYSLFGGLADLGYGINSIYKVTGHFKKFINSLNKLITSLVDEELSKLILDENNIKTHDFDTMAGMTGVASYLLLYKDEQEIRECIEKVLSYLIILTYKKEIFGHKVPNYYLSPENHYSQQERDYYNKGSFNLGLSHGIAGPLAILSIALSEGIEVEGQRKAIEDILKDLKFLCYIDKNQSAYWPDRVRFNDYVNRSIKMETNRASWCYGSPGVARAIYLAGKAIDDKESIELSLKAIDGLCRMDIDEWMLKSPTICHGYAGLLLVIEAMYIDTKNTDYKKCIDKLTSIILNFYKEESIFGFLNIDPKELENGIYKMVEEDNITLLQGSIGVMLTLLSTIKPRNTSWERHFLIR